MTQNGVFILFLWSSSPRLSTCQLDFLSGIDRLFKSGVAPGNLITNNVDGGRFGKDEACLPYLGELTRIFWGNCKQQADARAWLTWSKTIQEAFDSGKITLENALKETCRLTAEKETCEKMGVRLRACDVFGVIEAFVQSSQTKQRCEKVGGFIFQPQNGLQNAGQLVGNEIVGGLLKKFLFGQ